MQSSCMDVVLGVMDLGGAAREAGSIQAEAASLARLASQRLYIAVRVAGAGAGLSPALLRDLTHVFEGIASVDARLCTVPLLPWAGWTADRVAGLADVSGLAQVLDCGEAGYSALAAAGSLTPLPPADVATEERRSLVLQLLQHGSKAAADVATAASSSHLPAVQPAAVGQQVMLDVTPSDAAAAATAAADAELVAAAAATAAGAQAAAAAKVAGVGAGAEAAGAAAAAVTIAGADTVAAAAAGVEAAAAARMAATGVTAAAAAGAVATAAARTRVSSGAAGAAAAAAEAAAVGAAVAATGAAAAAAAAAEAAAGAAAAASAAAAAAAGASGAALAAGSSRPAVMQYTRVAMGGTFDRLHCGHMLLLAAAALVSVDKVFVGVTADALLSGKAHRGLLQQYDERRDAAVRYLKLVRPGLQVEAGRLLDPKEPTAAELDASMQALVVSAETLAGGEQINAGRQRRGFEPLQLVVVDLVRGHTAGSGVSAEGAKLSSSELRAIDKAAGNSSVGVAGSSEDGGSGGGGKQQ